MVEKLIFTKEPKYSIEQERKDLSELKNQIIIWELEYDMDYNEELKKTMDHTITMINSSSHLQFIGWRKSISEKNKPKLGYDIRLWNIVVPRATWMNIYNRTAWIKSDEWGAEFYINHSETTFDAQMYEWEKITDSLKKTINDFAKQKNIDIDTNALWSVTTEVVIRDLYWSNIATTSGEKWKEYLNKQQNLEEVLVRYNVKASDWKNYKFTTRQYLSHKVPKPRNKDLYNTTISWNEVGKIWADIQWFMNDYRIGLVWLIETQADLNRSSKIEQQETVVENFFKSIYQINEKDDVATIKTRFDNIKKNIQIIWDNINIWDVWWNDAVKKYTWSEDWKLVRKDILRFLQWIISDYQALQSKSIYYSDQNIPAQKWNEVIGNQFEQLRQWMWEFPDVNKTFSMLILKEQVSMVLYQSSVWNLYYWGNYASEKKTDPSTNKQVTLRKTIELTDVSLKHIITEVYNWYLSARTAEEKNHKNDTKNLILRQGLQFVNELVNPSDYFDQLCKSELLQKQFTKTYDTQSNSVIKSSNWSYITRLEDWDHFKLWINNNWKYFVLSKTANWFKIDENWRSYLLWNVIEDRQAISAFLQVTQKIMEDIWKEYDKSVINRNKVN